MTGFSPGHTAGCLLLNVLSPTLAAMNELPLSKQPSREPPPRQDPPRATRVPPRFFNAGAWVNEQFHTKEVQEIVGNTKRKKRYLAAAELVEPRFKAQFPDPYPGETAHEFQARREATHSQRRDKLVRWEAETQEEHAKRMASLRTNLATRFRELAHDQKRKHSLPAAAPLPPAQKHRDLSGLDVFQQSSEAPEGQVVTNASGVTYFDVGGQRAACTERWEAMSPAQRAPYEQEACRRNTQRREEEAMAEESVDEEPSMETYAAHDIAAWCLKNLETMKRVFKWGGFICVGGPDENGIARCFVQSVGENRYGESLLELLRKGTSVAAEELEALATLWVEQCREVIPSEEQQSDVNVAAGIISAVQERRTLCEPSPYSFVQSTASTAVRPNSLASQSAEWPLTPLATPAQGATPQVTDIDPQVVSTSSSTALNVGSRSPEATFADMTRPLSPSRHPSPSSPELLDAMQDLTFCPPPSPSLQDPSTGTLQWQRYLKPNPLLAIRVRSLRRHKAKANSCLPNLPFPADAHSPDMPDFFEIVPAKEPMLIRLVLWTENGHLPFWRMVPFEIGRTLALRDLDWLVAACEHFLLTPLEILEHGIWRAHRLDTAELELYDYSPTHLVRLLGVEHCPLLGYELEDIDRYLGIPRPCPNPEVRDNREWFQLRHVQVVLWKEDGHLPVHHLVSFNDDNKLQLAFHSPLDEDLYPWNRVDIWLAAEEEWAMVSTLNSFELDAAYDTLLIKFPFVECLPGFGSQLCAFDAVKSRPHDFGELSYTVTEESSNSRNPQTASLVHEGIPAFYNIAMSTKASRDVLKHAAQRHGEYRAVVPHVIGYVPETFAEVLMGLASRKRKRTGDADEPPRLVCRRFAEV
ncbi:hypothetical protein C8T65DRAFT_696370 [Cerioporus squamosus]|nr:hypothetical protein C8T65DRAFT_696370 [Cerioporus squamosus]